MNKYTIIAAMPIGHYGNSITQAHHVTLENDLEAAHKWAFDRGLSIWFVLKGHCEYSEGWK